MTTHGNVDAVSRGDAPVTDLLFGLGAELDDEGRPLGERRAPSAAKAGVEIVLRACPYRDARRGLPMNVSALTQVTDHLEQVAREIESFRDVQDAARAASWHGVMQVVVDSLFAPGRFQIESRLEGRSNTATPAAHAVAHKLAAGYFGVVQGILQDELRGVHHPFTVEHLLEHVCGTRALHGASEVCAGPPAMIERTTRLLMKVNGSASPSAGLSQRLEVSDLMATQLELGSKYRALDAALECRLFSVLGPEPRARNDFVRRRYAARRAELADEGAPQESDATFFARTASSHELPELDLLLSDGGGALLASENQLPELRRVVAMLLEGYVESVHLQAALELRLRRVLRLADAPLRSRNNLVLPLSNTARWLEVLTGASLRYGANHGLTLHRIHKPPVDLTPEVRTDAA